MPTLRTINHPGLEIKEYDQSLYTPLAGGTTSLVMGFASKGEDVIPYEVTSRESLLNYYGQPTNEAERYFYYAATDVLVNGGKLVTAKLPYSNESANTYKSTLFTVDASKVSLSASSTVADKIITAYTLSGVAPADIPAGYVKTTDLPGYTQVVKITADLAPFTLATSALENYRAGVAMPTINTICIVDKNKSLLSKDAYNNNNGEVLGIFPVITTALNALPVQNMLNLNAPADALAEDINMGYNSISALTTAGLSSTILNPYGFAVPLNEGTYLKDSLSRTLAKSFPTITYSEDASGNTILDPYNMKKIMVSVVALKIDPNYNNKLVYTVLENFVGSLDSSAKNDDGTTSYIQSIVNANSNYIELYSNVTTALASTNEFYFADNLKGVVLGFTEAETLKDMNSGEILQSIDTVMDKLSNVDELELDVIVDAGLSNIVQYLNDKALGDTETVYDPEGLLGTKTVQMSTYIPSASGTVQVPYAWSDRIDAIEDVEQWKAVLAKYVTFCSKTRKDCMFYADGLRNLSLEGKNKIVRKGTTTSIDIDILPRLKYLTGVNNNYGAMDVIWWKRVDTFTGNSFWCPPSIPRTVATIYTDNSFNYWDAPAGFTRGVINGATDISFNPNGSQADSIYNKAFNYLQFYPNDGIVLEGQKTLQTKPSAFDRINVRRLFLKIERLCRRTLRWYVYELNNLQLRNRIYDQLDAILAPVKVAGGIYDYAINLEDVNTASVIDNNELRCVIMIKPTKVAEYIIATFVAVSTGMSFSEVNLAQVS